MHDCTEKVHDAKDDIIELGRSEQYVRHLWLPAIFESIPFIDWPVDGDSIAFWSDIDYISTDPLASSLFILFSILGLFLTHSRSHRTLIIIMSNAFGPSDQLLEEGLALDDSTVGEGKNKNKHSLRHPNLIHRKREKKKEKLEAKLPTVMQGAKDVEDAQRRLVIKNEIVAGIGEFCGSELTCYPAGVTGSDQ